MLDNPHELKHGDLVNISRIFTHPDGTVVNNPLYEVDPFTRQLRVPLKLKLFIVQRSAYGDLSFEPVVDSGGKNAG